MWLSAAAQHVAAATDGRPPRARLVGGPRASWAWSPGDEIDFRVDRVGIDPGAEVIEITARDQFELVMAATARLAAPKTVYASQAGHPAQGHGHGGARPLKAARKCGILRLVCAPVSHSFRAALLRARTSMPMPLCWMPWLGNAYTVFSAASRAVADITSSERYSQ